MTVVKNREIKSSSEFKECHIMLEYFSNKAPFLILTPAIFTLACSKANAGISQVVFKLNY